MIKKIWLAFALAFMTLHGLGAEVIEIPNNVIALYAFLQKPGDFERGSSEEIATAVDKQEFVANLPRYISVAKQRQMKLIVTAETADGDWVQNQIRFKGQNLRTARYRHPNERIDRVVPGAEFPLD